MLLTCDTTLLGVVATLRTLDDYRVNIHRRGVQLDSEVGSVAVDVEALGVVTVGISSNPGTKILNAADIQIFTDTGAEVLTGSTRLKAGTAQKIVLNTLTTCAMAKTGKVYENMMINLSPSNEKLKRRVIRIVQEILSCDDTEAITRLEKNEWNIRKAITANKEKL